MRNSVTPPRSERLPGDQTSPHRLQCPMPSHQIASRRAPLLVISSKRGACYATGSCCLRMEERFCLMGGPLLRHPPASH